MTVDLKTNKVKLYFIDKLVEKLFKIHYKYLKSKKFKKYKISYQKRIFFYYISAHYFIYLSKSTK